jgi:hypothetical protein
VVQRIDLSLDNSKDLRFFKEMRPINIGDIQNQLEENPFYEKAWDS